MVRRKSLVDGRLLIVALFSLMVAGCQTGGTTAQSTSGANSAYVAEQSLGPSASEKVAVGYPQDQSRYFIEFRARYALSYGHSFVIFGRLNESGEMINPEVAGLAPAGDVGAYAAGHVLPVPATTGWTDGDLEDKYMSANWRVMLTEAEYKKVVAYIRKLQANSPVWQASVYNCNAFVAKIAQSMGYKTAFIWARPQQFITALRERNGGPNAIGETRAKG